MSAVAAPATWRSSWRSPMSNSTSRRNSAISWSFLAWHCSLKTPLQRHGIPVAGHFQAIEETHSEENQRHLGRMNDRIDLMQG